MVARLFAIASAAAVLAFPAIAHHSHAMFDTTVKIELDGTVKEFEWTNPHAWLQVLVLDAQGVAREWNLELGSVAQLSRAGWRPKVVVPGDKVSVTIHPLKEGGRGGAVVSVVLPNGTTMGGEND